MYCLFICLPNPVGCLQDTFESADSICDDKIRQWLHDRKKHADPKRKRSRAKSKNQEKIVSVAGNTPKRHTRSTRHAKRVDSEETMFSPVAASMVITPVVKHVHKNRPRKQKKNKICPVCNVCLYCLPW